MSKEQTQNAPTAAEQNPEKSAINEKKDAKAAFLAALSPPILAIDLETIDPKKLEMAEDFGIPIGEIIDWVESNQDWQIKVTSVLAEIAEANGQVVGFIHQVNEAQAAQQKLMDERKKTEEEFLRTHPEYKQQPQQQQGGGLIGMAQQFLPQIMGALNPNPVNEKMSKFFDAVIDKSIENVVNPPKDPLAAIGEKFLTEYSSKAAAALAAKVAP